VHVEVIEPTVVTPQVATRTPSRGHTPPPSSIPRPAPSPQSATSPQSAPSPQPTASPRPTATADDYRGRPDPREPPPHEAFGIDPEIGPWDRRCTESCRDRWVDFYNEWNWQLHEGIPVVTPEIEKLSGQLVEIRQDLQRMLERSVRERDTEARNLNAYAPPATTDLSKIPMAGWLTKLLNFILKPN
jgi:hypothetical protein